MSKTGPIQFVFLKKEELPSILPLIQLLNPDKEPGLLSDRLHEMAEQPYGCLVAKDERNEVIAACGFWITTRFYSGKQLEVDNVVVHPDHRSAGLGRKLMARIYEHAESLGCIRCELSTYVTFARAQKFYFNEGFEIIGFRMRKILQESDESTSRQGC